MLQQLHRLQPLEGIRSLAVVQRPAHGPWRVALLYTGELTAAVLDQARQGSVRSIETGLTSLVAAVARRVVPELLGAGCSLLELLLDNMQLNSTWAATFGEAAVCSAVLRSLSLEGCSLRGPLPELRLPALQLLNLHNNELTGGLEPLRSCTALLALSLGSNQLTGRLEPLRACTALRELDLENNRTTPSEEEKALFKKQRASAKLSSAAIKRMALAEVVAALRAHVGVARVAENGCARLRVLCEPAGSEQAAADAGAVEAVVGAMRAHPQEAGVQEAGCAALRNICYGTDVAVLARIQQRAAEAGALEAVAAAMQAHLQVVGVQEWGCRVLRNICSGGDTAAPARKQRAAEAGAIEVVAAAMQAHPQVVDVQVQGCAVLRKMCSDNDAAAPARRQRAVEAGALEVVVEAMRAHPQVVGVQKQGGAALSNMH